MYLYIHVYIKCLQSRPDNNGDYNYNNKIRDIKINSGIVVYNIHINKYVYTYVYMYTYIYIYIYIYIYFNKHVCIYVHTYVYMYLSMYIHMQICVYKHKYRNIYIFTYIHIYIFIYIQHTVFICLACCASNINPMEPRKPSCSSSIESAIRPLQEEYSHFFLFSTDNSISIYG
jgi:hypothetical protein